MTSAFQRIVLDVRRRGDRTRATRGYWNGAAWGTLLVFSMVMLRIGEQLGPVRYLKPVLLSTTVVLAIHLVCSSRAVWISAWSKPQMRLTLAYIICIVASVPFSVWRSNSVGLVWIAPWGVALVFVCALTPPIRSTTDRIFRLLSWLSAVYAILVMAAGQVVESRRMTSSGSYDSNDLGALFAFSLFLALGATIRGRPLSRVVSGVSAAILLWALLMTGSRGGLLALGAGCLTFVLGFRPRAQFAILLTLVLATPVAWRFAPPVMRERASTLVSLDDDYNTTSNSGRVYLWKRGVLFAVQNPVVGVGAGGFSTKLGRDFSEQGTRGAWHTAHNTYVQVFAELGVPGGVVLMALLYSCFSVAARYWRWTKAVHRPEYLASVLAYLTSIAFLSHGYSYLLFGIIGLSILFSSPEELSRRKKSSAHVLAGGRRGATAYRLVAMGR